MAGRVPLYPKVYISADEFSDILNVLKLHKEDRLRRQLGQIGYNNGGCIRITPGKIQLAKTMA